jgi:2-polyprenyl-3-methyl-5-hydroxy-6-metoxy-1,4-benzoquinol methylase
MNGAVRRAFVTWMPAPIVALVRGVRNSLRLAWNRRRYRFTYSREFYEQGYHEILADKAGATLEFWEAAGYRDRLMEVCDALERHVTFAPHTRYLEVACMYGKTAFWMAERYPQLDVWAFDFSERFVEATRAANPIGTRLTVWRGDATDIRLENERFDRSFDLVTCIDVTEHLPDGIYRQMLAELARVTRAGGHLVLMQGNTVQVEHIHVLPEDELVGDVVAAGFEYITTLPERHHLFRRPASAPSSPHSRRGE